MELSFGALAPSISNGKNNRREFLQIIVASLCRLVPYLYNSSSVRGWKENTMQLSGNGNFKIMHPN